MLEYWLLTEVRLSSMEPGRIGDKLDDAEQTDLMNT